MKIINEASVRDKVKFDLLYKLILSWRILSEQPNETYLI